ncbi:IS30 family transposase [Blastococcus sp. HT6-4]
MKTGLTDVYGLGPVSAATILGEVADIRRYRSRHAFAAANGTAPIPASSGRTTRHRLNRSGNRTLNRVLYMIAITQIRADTEGRAYYQRKRAEGKTNREALRCLKRRLSDVTSLARQTLTWDQGSEMAYHHLLEEYFADGILFAPPASPWLRGTNETTNGLLRQYFPKGSDLRTFTLTDLRTVEQRINSRPRKRLPWRSPARAMATELAG